MFTRTALFLALAVASSSTVVAAPSPADGGTPATSVHDERQQAFEQSLEAAYTLADDGNHRDAERALTKLIADPRFVALPASEQRLALSTAALAAIHLERPEQARDLLSAATRHGGTDPDDWYRLSWLELQLGHHDAAAKALIEFTERWPELLPNIDEMLIHQVRHQLPDDSPQRLALSQALFDANWTSKFGSDGGVWYDLAVEQAKRGNGAAVLAAVRRISAPEDLMRLRSDKRFDTYVQADAWAFNVENAARRMVDTLQERADTRPRDLKLRSQLSYALLTTGRHDEVIALVDRTLTTIETAKAAAPGNNQTAAAVTAADAAAAAADAAAIGADKAAARADAAETAGFDDLEDRVWLMNNRAIALRRLGRTEDALAELIRASQLSEYGLANVSQALNLGSFYCSLGRPDDARAAIARAGDDISPFGRMVSTVVQHCAALQKGDRSAARKTIDYLRKHHDDAPTIYLEALLRSGDLDAAAKFYSEMLSSDDKRGQALEFAQDVLRPAPLPGDVEVRQAHATLLARDDVRAAIDRVGRIGHYDIYAINEMD